MATDILPQGVDEVLLCGQVFPHSCELLGLNTYEATHRICPETQAGPNASNFGNGYASEAVSTNRCRHLRLKRTGTNYISGDLKNQDGGDDHEYCGKQAIVIVLNFAGTKMLFIGKEPTPPTEEQVQHLFRAFFGHYVAQNRT